ncbi:YetF domain-containing protein, partial [Bacillus thuringiensis]|uniref:YetF domain-containing protein n=1 Tax=Bacillus thuringiensis TaxID=1428 RepID=UPI003D6C87A8
QLLPPKTPFTVPELQFPLLQPTRQLNLLLNKHSHPLTPKHIRLKLPNQKQPQTLIIHQNILHEPLSPTTHNHTSLHSQLQKLPLLIQNLFLRQLHSYP